ncbi:tetratricopeptide repeat-containing sensor histidine kinase [Flavobacterium filum]|uniref:tetratricopeptide repeat-containing sensor histidine kinase n=1 Tax=Flavobacterium filum TaxID=370974 RepID=UPI000406188F|nr:tetratricopeptide repeat-containing sensor histidine kinase [Flavobacterium filum]
MKTNLLFLLYILLSSIFIQAQNPDINKIEKLLKEGKSLSIINYLKDFEKNTNDENLALIFYYKAKAYANENQMDKALNYLLKAQKKYSILKNENKVYELKLEIAEIYSSFNHVKNEAPKLFNEYIAFANRTKNDSMMAIGLYKKAIHLLINDSISKARSYYFKALSHNIKTNDKNTLVNIYNGLAVIYNEKLNLPDSAIYYLSKNLLLNKNADRVNELCKNYVNLAASFTHKKNYIKAIEYLEEAEKLPITEHVKRLKNLILLFKSKNFEKIGDYKTAYELLSEYAQNESEYNQEDIDNKLSEFHVYFQTQEKSLENENLKSQNKILEKTQKIDKLILIILLGFIVTTIVIAFLWVKNLKKKNTINEQQIELQKEKMNSILKEQELQNIDIMLESQEKERVKLANELHDNLGSMLATLRLNFQNLKRQKGDLEEQESKLYEKTDELIEEAYQKVRNLAHYKNLGVIGNEGLVPAVKSMADKMSILNLLDINVIPFGLKERLDNQLEVGIFRMIQELCTNIIKHAKASQVNIYITQHNHTDINIIIEDNGFGFEVNKLNSNTGMGLKNIEKKVEQMGGSFTIDSILGKGTTIIIDLPL